MLVGKRMTREPVTVGPRDTLAAAKDKMTQGGFRRLPVVEEGRLVGILSERDLRQHTGYLENTKTNVAMTEDPLTVTPAATLEEAAQLLLRRKVGGLPVVEAGKLVGIITTSDILQAFLDVMGVSEKETARIDIMMEGPERDLSGAARTIAAHGGEILGVGTYRETWEERPVFYVRVRAIDPDRVASMLKKEGYDILGLHR